MDLKELRQLTVPELEEKSQQLTQELFNLRFQLGTGRLENPMQVRKTKRSIAQGQDDSTRARAGRCNFYHGERGLRMAESANKRREWVGRVVSNKMNKTVVVEIERSVIHPLYRKVLRRVTKFKAHDEDNACKIGDRVRMVETRPISKDKHMRVVEVVEKGRDE